MRMLQDRLERLSFFDSAPAPLFAIFWRDVPAATHQKHRGVMRPGVGKRLLRAIFVHFREMATWTIAPGLDVSRVSAAIPAPEPRHAC